MFEFAVSALLHLFTAEFLLDFFYLAVVYGLLCVFVRR